jgi:hypothetical protein
MGYLPRGLAQLLAPEVDAGQRFSGAVQTVRDAEVPSVTIRISREPLGLDDELLRFPLLA